MFYRILQGLNKFKQYSIIQITTSSFRVTLIIYSIYTEIFDLHLLLYFEIFIIILGISLQSFQIPFKSLVRGKSSFNEYYKLIKFSSPLYANNLITFAYDRIGIFVIGVLITAKSVAIYDVSTKIPSALQGILSSYVLVFFPNISTLFNIGDNKSAEKLINKSLSYISLLLSVLIVGIALWNKEIVQLLFSSKYLESALPLTIMMFALSARNLSNVLGYSIVAAGYSKIPMKVNAVSVLIGIMSTLFFVSQWNYIGAAFAALLMNIVSLTQYSLYHRKLKLVRLNFAYSYSLISAAIFVLIDSAINTENFLIKFLMLTSFLIINYRNIFSIKKLFLELKAIKSTSQQKFKELC